MSFWIVSVASKLTPAFHGEGPPVSWESGFGGWRGGNGVEPSVDPAPCTSRVQVELGHFTSSISLLICLMLSFTAFLIIWNILSVFVLTCHFLFLSSLIF